jgi:hypothetical protein
MLVILYQTARRYIHIHRRENLGSTIYYPKSADAEMFALFHGTVSEAHIIYLAFITA